MTNIKWSLSITITFEKISLNGISSISYDIKRPIFNSDQLMNAFDLYDEVPTGLDIKSCIFIGGKNG